MVNDTVLPGKFGPVHVSHDAANLQWCQAGGVIDAVARRVAIVVGPEQRSRAGVGIRPSGEQRGGGFHISQHAGRVQRRACREQPFARLEVHLLAGARSARGGRQVKPPNRAWQILLATSSKAILALVH